MRLSSIAAVSLLAGLVAVATVLWADATAGQPAPQVFHVSPNGNDQNPGSQDKPFATPGRAEMRSAF